MGRDLVVRHRSREDHLVFEAEPPFRPDGPGAEGEYVLAVATLEPRKNLERLVEGYVRARTGLELRVAGPSGWGDTRVAGPGFPSSERRFSPSGVET